MAWNKAFLSSIRSRSIPLSRAARQVHWSKLAPNRQKAAFEKYKSVAYASLAASATVVMVAVLPPFKETRKGFEVAVYGPRPAVSPLWSMVLGPLGGFAAFMGSTANIVKIGYDYPVLAGFKTPIALTGGVVGSYLCYYLTPVMMDSARMLARAVAFSADGLVADVFGRPHGQRAAWETSGLWGSEGPEMASPEAKALDARMRQSLDMGDTSLQTGGGGQNKPAEAAAAVGGGEPQSEEALREETQKEIRWMVAELLRLRGQERTLKKILREIRGTEAGAVLAEDQHAELRAIAHKKQSLKDAAQHRYHVSLGKRTETELMQGVVRLQGLRYKQLSLADELFRGVRAERRPVIESELRRFDIEKEMLKRQFQREFGLILSHRTKRVQRWKHAAKHGIATGRRGTQMGVWEA